MRPWAHRDRAARRADGRIAVTASDAGALGERLAGLAAGLDDLARRLRDAGVDPRAAGLARTAVLGRPEHRLTWDSAEPAEGLDTALGVAAEWLTGADSASVQRRAAVRVVREALGASTEARRAAEAEGRREGETQTRSDEARQRRDESAGSRRRRRK